MATLEATLYDQDRHPIRGEKITFLILSPLAVFAATGTAAQEGTTNAQGIVHVRVQAGTMAGSGKVMAITGTRIGSLSATTPITLLPNTGLKLPHGITQAHLIRLPGESNLDVITRLYQLAIPDGPFRTVPLKGLEKFPPGLQNNSAALLIPKNQDNSIWQFVCAGYQAQVLEFLNTLRAHPETQKFFTDVDYGPIKAFQEPNVTFKLFGIAMPRINPFSHFAVAMYPRGKDWKTDGIVLDPWIEQTPRTYPIAQWNRLMLWTATPDDMTSQGLYPITRMVDVPLDDPNRYPAPGVPVKSAPYPGRPNDPPLDDETYGLQIIVDGPVPVVITDSQKRRNGILDDGSLLTEIPFSGFYNLPRKIEDIDGTRLSYFILLKGNYTLTLTGKEPANTNILVTIGDAITGTASYFQYENVSISTGQSVNLALNPVGPPPPLTLPDGKVLYPVTIQGPTTGLTATGTWSGWSAVPGGGQSSSQPAALLDGSSTLRLYIQGADNGLWVNTKTGSSTWSGWSAVSGGGKSRSAPAVLLDGNEVRLVVRGLDDGLWTTLADNPRWTALGGKTNHSPAAVMEDSTIHVFVRGTDGRLYLNSRSGGSFSGWSAVPGGGQSSSQPAALLDGSSAVRLYIQGADNGLWVNTKSGSTWSGWSAVSGGGKSRSAPAVLLDGNEVRLVVRGLDDGLWTALADNPQWTALGGKTQHAPATVGSTLHLVVRGTDGGLYLNSRTGGSGASERTPSLEQ